MKMQEALLKLKNLKARLAKTQASVVASIVHYEDEVPEFNFVEEFTTHVALEQEILALKTAVQYTNVKTQNVQGVTLAELILLNADLRSKLAFTNKLLEQTITFEGGRLYGSNKTKDSVNKRYAEGYSKKMLRSALVALEQTKEAVEAQIARLNMTTELLGHSETTIPAVMDHMTPEFVSSADHLQDK